MSPIMRGPPLYAGIYGCKTIDSSIVEWVGLAMFRAGWTSAPEDLQHACSMSV